MCFIYVLVLISLTVDANAITNPDPLWAYKDEARRYKTRYGRPYTLDDGEEDNLAFELDLLAIFTEYVDAGEDLVELFKQQVISFCFTNPYPSHDPCRAVLDKKRKS